MSHSLTTLFALYILTPGRRIYASGRVRELAEAHKHPALFDVIDAAIAHDRHVLELDAARRSGMSIKAVPVRAKDSIVDRTLTIIHSVLSHCALDDDGDPPGAASDLLATLFPVSLSHHTHLAFIEQSAANERVLGILEGDDHEKWIDAHGLRYLVQRLRAAHERFAAALKARDSASAPTWKEVSAARATGQELYLQVVVQILAKFAEDPDTRDLFLGPIFDQDRKIQAYRRQRRVPVDVNPDSGELLEPTDPEPTDEAPADAPATD